MRLAKPRWQVFVVCILGLAAADLYAQNAATLTRAEWAKRVGPSVSDSTVLLDTMTQIVPEEKVEFARRVIKAATRLPASPEEKGVALVRASVACIAGSSGDSKKAVIAEVIAGVPIEYLPVVTEELGKRFDQEYNNLSDDQYGKVAEETLDMAVKRNAKSDIPSVRNTFVILAFLRGAKDAGLQDRLIARLPDERMRNLAAFWLPPALKDKKYDAMLAAADIDEAPARRREMPHHLIGHASLDRLLADLYASQDVKRSEEVDEIGTNVAWLSRSQVLAASGGATFGVTTKGMLDHAPDYGINRVPRPDVTRYPTGYQNQSCSCEKPSILSAR